jgi:hypothetical protein
VPRLLRRVPWLVLFELARTTRAHLGERLEPADRRRVAHIVRASKGDPRRVSAAERDELRAIARRLDLARLARDLLPALASRRGRRRR